MEKYSILNVALNQYFLFILKTSRFKGLHYFSLQLCNSFRIESKNSDYFSNHLQLNIVTSRSLLVICNFLSEIGYQQS